MWEPREIESMVQTALHGQLGVGTGAEKFARYTSARNGVVTQILPGIKAILPQMTDHGQPHVENVLGNIPRLLGSSCVGVDNAAQLSAVEAYCLLLATVFHDVGNIHGRKDHQKNIGDAYDHVFSAADRDLHEKQILLWVVGAHCGAARDGSGDTLKDVPLDHHLWGHPVRLRDIAAILRFADELAEGPQRTSTFMAQLGYDDSARLYHEYARSTRVFIDRPHGRIALSCHIEILGGGLKLETADRKRLKDLVDFIDARATRVYEEMQYAGHYCVLLPVFKATSVSVSFWAEGSQIDLGLDPVILEDLVVPGKKKKLARQINPRYRPETLMKALERGLAARPRGLA
jgi:hypothetical protein